MEQDLTVDPNALYMQLFNYLEKKAKQLKDKYNEKVDKGGEYTVPDVNFAYIDVIDDLKKMLLGK